MTGKELAATAVRIANGADLLKPAADDPCRNALETAVYHLRQAARITREVAERRTEREAKP